MGKVFENQEIYPKFLKRNQNDLDIKNLTYLKDPI